MAKPDHGDLGGARLTDGFEFEFLTRGRIAGGFRVGAQRGSGRVWKVDFVALPFAVDSGSQLIRRLGRSRIAAHGCIRHMTCTFRIDELEKQRQPRRVPLFPNSDGAGISATA